MNKTPNGTHTALVPWLACFAALLCGANFLLFLQHQVCNHWDRMAWCPHNAGYSEEESMHPALLPFEGDDEVWYEEEVEVEVGATINDEENAVVVILQ